MATIVVGAVAITMQLLSVAATLFVWTTLTFAPPEGFDAVRVTDADLRSALRGWALSGVVVAACVAAIVVAVRRRERASSPLVHAALLVAVVGLAVSLSQWELELGPSTSWTW